MDVSLSPLRGKGGVRGENATSRQVTIKYNTPHSFPYTRLKQTLNCQCFADIPTILHKAFGIEFFVANSPLRRHTAAS